MGSQRDDEFSPSNIPVPCLSHEEEPEPEQAIAEVWERAADIHVVVGADNAESQCIMGAEMDEVVGVDDESVSSEVESNASTESRALDAVTFSTEMEEIMDWMNELRDVSASYVLRLEDEDFTTELKNWVLDWIAQFTRDYQFILPCFPAV